MTAALAAPPDLATAWETGRADAEREAAELVEQGGRGEYHPWLLTRAIALAAAFPSSVPLQTAVAKLTASAGDAGATKLCWGEILARHPGEARAFAGYLRAIATVDGPAAAGRVLDAHAPDSVAITDPAEALRAAAGLAELERRDEAEALLARVAEAGDHSVSIALALARVREDAGRLDDARDALLGARAAGGGDAVDRPLARLEARIAMLGERPEPGLEGPPSFAALARLLDRALDARLARAPMPRVETIGGVMLIGGTLGGGGAERQLVNTALALQRMTATRGARLLGPVTVVCRKLDRRRANDFYLPALEAAGIRVIDYLRAEPWGGDRAAARLGDARDLVALLPDRMREGTVRLVELLRAEAPDAVQIWQDGMIYAAGLAALAAQVPRILLNVRTMPPNTRADRLRPEQLLLYGRLLRAPGVALIANSLAVARAYEDWLALAGGSVPVIPNGVTPADSHADPAGEALWSRFDAASGGGFVLGGIMRLDDNKRPLAWLEIAAEFAVRRPNARFVLLGSGPLRAAAEDYARRLGIAERTLFVGRSLATGFWLEKMDTLALTSRHEGLPNVLIEAQLAGVPVIATPAGGASEAVAPIACNLVLEDARHIDAEAAADRLEVLAVRSPARREEDAAALATWARARFSLEAMAARTLDLLRG